MGVFGPHSHILLTNLNITPFNHDIVMTNALIILNLYFIYLQVEINYNNFYHTFILSIGLAKVYLLSKLESESIEVKKLLIRSGKSLKTKRKNVKTKTHKMFWNIKHP